VYIQIYRESRNYGLEFVENVVNNSDMWVDYKENIGIYLLAINNSPEDQEGHISFSVIGFPTPAFGTKEILLIVFGSILLLILFGCLLKY
jgi:hypothetical protein